MTTQSRDDLVYTPVEIGRYTLEEIERRRASASIAIPIGLPKVDKMLQPLRAGQLITIIGRPGHYKSGLAQWWARRVAQTPGEGAVVYATCEMAIEELALYDMARDAKIEATRLEKGEISDAEWLKLQAAAMRRAALPVWLLGHSLARRRKRVRMSIYSLEQALYWMEDQMDAKARLLVIDYLNLMQSDRQPGRSDGRRVDVSDVVQCAKDMALSLGCPVILLAQAHRRVDERGWKLPQMADAQETAAIEQYSDKMFSVWMPRVTDGPGTQVTGPDRRPLCWPRSGAPVTITDNLLFLALLKQKTGPANGYWPLYVDFEHNEVKEMAEPG